MMERYHDVHYDWQRGKWECVTCGAWLQTRLEVFAHQLEGLDLTREERKTLAFRLVTGTHPRLCERLYPKCCQYHEGFDDALAEFGWLVGTLVTPTNQPSED